MNRVVHFEMQADDVERAVAFYSEVFGWVIKKAGMSGWDYWMIMTADKDSSEPGINGGIIKRHKKTPPLECGINAYVCCIVVDDFDGVAKKILAQGGKVAVPKFAFPNHAWQGYFIDTENNTFGIHQPDSNAA